MRHILARCLPKPMLSYYIIRMEMVLFPEVGPPPPDGAEPLHLDLAVRAEAMSNSNVYLHRQGMTLPPPTPEDRRAAAALVTSYASAPHVASAHATTTRMGTMTAAALRHIDAMLKSFGQEVVQDSVQIRHYVTNKLIEESDNPDPKVRMRALELLGKISEVGLFSERKEMTVTHQTTDDLKESLRAKLSKLTSDDVIDAEVVEQQTPLPKPDLDAMLSRLDDDD